MTSGGEVPDCSPSPSTTFLSKCVGEPRTSYICPNLLTKPFIQYLIKQNDSFNLPYAVKKEGIIVGSDHDKALVPVWSPVVAEGIRSRTLTGFMELDVSNKHICVFSMYYRCNVILTTNSSMSDRTVITIM